MLDNNFYVWSLNVVVDSWSAHCAALKYRFSVSKNAAACRDRRVWHVYNWCHHGMSNLSVPVWAVALNRLRFTSRIVTITATTMHATPAVSVGAGSHY